jgi:hypothetical protein
MVAKGAKDAKKEFSNRGRENAEKMIRKKHN